MAGKVTTSHTSLTRFREILTAFYAYDDALKTRKDNPEDYRFPEREEVLAKDLERCVVRWLETILKP